jgi:hypothetical protein
MRRLSLKTTLLVLLTAFSFFSCKKNSTSDYYVKLKINGTWITWTKVAGELGPDFGDPTKTDLGVTAEDDAMKDVFDIGIQIDGSNFTTGSYPSDNVNYTMYISYTKDAATANFKYYDIQNASGRPDSKYIVTITSITSSQLRGTFTGNYLHDYSDDESLDITEGEFFVKRVR